MDPRLHATYEDGSFFPDDDYPAMVVLRTGVPESHVIMGFQRRGITAGGDVGLRRTHSRSSILASPCHTLW